MSTPKITVPVDPETEARWKAEASRRQMSVAALVREAMREKEERQAQEKS